MPKEIIEGEVIEEVLDLEVVPPEQASIVVQREVVNYEKLMEMASMLAKSTIIPASYQNRPENIFVALDLATRMEIPIMMVMQNLYVIQGKPSWSGQAIASLVRSSGQFRDVELHYFGEEGTDTRGAYVTATNNRSGKPIIGSKVTMKMAKAEGWMSKSGSKWLTLPELMLGYRAFTYFGRLHAPELLSGLQSSDEIEDVTPVRVEAINPYAQGGK